MPDKPPDDADHNEQLATLVACPRCDKTPLAGGDGGFRCDACKIDFPNIGGIPWLFADPDATLGEWRNRLHFAIQQLGHETARLETELKQVESPLIRRRLEHLLDASGNHRDKLREILAPVDVQSGQASYESYLALRTRLPADQALNTYYANVHRDWAWGEEENDASLRQIREVIEADSKLAKSPGRVLVLGAGACRLAYDIHTKMSADMTVAIDFNPLLMLIAGRVLEGQPLELYEFPIAPKSAGDFAVLQKLGAPEPADENLHLVLGDVLRAPFRAFAFDTVVTPWLIDIVAEDLPVFAMRINRLLADGGRWVNFGSLSFDHPERARRYSAEEVQDIVGHAGFTKPVTREDQIPYMCSPASRHGRRENVFSFSSIKEKNMQPPPRHKALPDWIVTGKESVPLSQSFRAQALSTQVYSFVMSLIDGKRSIEDMAKIMEQQGLMTRQEAEPAIRNFLTRMFDDSQRNSSF